MFNKTYNINNKAAERIQIKTKYIFHRMSQFTHCLNILRRHIITAEGHVYSRINSKTGHEISNEGYSNKMRLPLNNYSRRKTK